MIYDNITCIFIKLNKYRNMSDTTNYRGIFYQGVLTSFWPNSKYSLKSILLWFLSTEKVYTFSVFLAHKDFWK